jgi:prepilin-type N-terminal cleavage/methylation domain-containing protein
MKKGFTLLEILLVIAAIGILAAIVIVAINPNRQLGQARNAQRRSDVNTILNAIYQYSIDTNGNFPVTFPDGDAPANEPAAEITDGAVECTVDSTDESEANLESLHNGGVSYLSGLPVDPNAGDDDSGNEPEGCTGYTVIENGGRITIAAPKAELSDAIDVTR